MNAELKNIALSSLHSNPYRNAELFPLREDRVEKIKASIEAEGFFEGVIARPAKKGFEIAFGHHRIEAARQVLGKDAKVAIIVRNLDDSEMLRFMERENIADGLGFYYTTVQVVRATVLAFAAGQIKLEDIDPKANTGQLRYAPSFLRGCVTNDGNAYTADSLARFLGRVKGAKDNADADIRTALDILELMEKKTLSSGQADLRVASHFEAVTTVTRAAASAARAKEAEAEAEAKILEEAAKRAEGEKDNKGKPAPDVKKATKLRERAAEIHKKVDAHVELATKEAAKQAVAMFKSGESAKTVRETLAPAIVKKGVKRIEKAVLSVEPMDRSEMESEAKRYDRILLEDIRARMLAHKSEGGRKVLRESVTRLQARVRELLKEL